MGRQKKQALSLNNYAEQTRTCLDPVLKESDSIEAKSWRRLIFKTATIPPKRTVLSKQGKKWIIKTGSLPAINYYQTRQDALCSFSESLLHHYKNDTIDQLVSYGRYVLFKNKQNSCLSYAKLKKYYRQCEGEVYIVNAATGHRRLAYLIDGVYPEVGGVRVSKESVPKNIKKIINQAITSTCL